MNCSKKHPILSIIISSYNRDVLLIKNINKLLACDCEEFEIIVGDNGSTDSTWKQLNTIRDKRLVAFRNERNLGFENFWILSAYARGKYFLFLNDRDYIDNYGLLDLCRMLNNIAEYDFISCEWSKNKIGEHAHYDAFKIYFDSRHPGMLIYNSCFVSRVLDRELIKKKLSNGHFSEANMYIVFQLLQNVDTVFVHDCEYVIQPPNRERIEKKRKEYYSAPYIALEYRQAEFSDWIKYADSMPRRKVVDDIILAMFADSLMTVTWEYYISMKIPGFAKRNHYENHKYDEWIFNGVLFTFYALNECAKYHRTIKKQIVAIMIMNYVSCLKKLIGK